MIGMKMDNFIIKKCEIGDVGKIDRFYRYVIDNTENMRQYGKWIYGLHPAYGQIEEYVKNGFMYFAENNNEILSAVAVTPFQGEEYENKKWQIMCKNNEVSTVHLLAVNPDYQREGIARKTMHEVIKLSENNNLKAIRLDALLCNTPAHKLYQSLGFKKTDVCSLYAKNVGQTDFYLFELLL